MNRLVLILAFLSLMEASSSRVQAENLTVIFGCNYTISVSIDGQEFSVSHRDRVSSGGAIPFNLQDFLFQLRITEFDAETAKVELVLSEKTEDGWHQIYATPPSFIVNLGIPTDFRHSDDIAKFDISLIASKTVL